MFLGGTTERGRMIDAVSTRTGTATMRFPSAKLLQDSLGLATRCSTASIGKLSR